MAIIGYRYFFGLHMGVSRGPVDELVEIKVGGRTAWAGSVTSSGTINIEAPNLFGGEEKEGGIVGPLTVMMGESTQTAPSALSTVLKSPMPGFRRMFTLFFDGMISAMNPYPKKWEVRARRALSGWDRDVWYPEKARISLVRTVSAGESTSTGGEVKTIRTSEVLVLGGGMTADLLKYTGSGINILSIQYDGHPYNYNSYDISGFGTVPVDAYTLSGNTLTFNYNVFTAGIPYGWYQLYVTYTQVVSTNGASTVAGAGQALIQAMNPAHIIYECLTNREWGRGLDPSVINDAAFRVAADRLSVESFGLCMRWTRRDEIKAFLQGVLDHIGGVLYPDRTTGLLTLKLLRDDYRVADLPVFDSESGLVEISEATTVSAGSVINEVRISYTDPVTNEERISRVVNIAARQSSNGAANVMSKTFSGLPTAEIANRVAMREMRAASPAIRKFEVTFDRRGATLYPGAVLLLRDLPRNIKPIVVRVATINYGTLTNGKVRATLVQDVFGTPATSFGVMPPPQWTPPNTQPCVSFHKVFELPYRSVYRSLSTGDFAQVDGVTDAYFGVAMDQGQPLNTAYDLSVKAGATATGEWPTDTSGYCGYVAP